MASAREPTPSGRLRGSVPPNRPWDFSLPWTTEIDEPEARDTIASGLRQQGYGPEVLGADDQTWAEPFEFRGGLGIGPPIGPHDLYVHTQPASHGCLIWIGADVHDFDEDSPAADALWRAFTEWLSERLPWGTPLYEGVVRTDGLGITFDGPAPPHPAGAIENPLGSGSKVGAGLVWFGIVSLSAMMAVAFFGFLADPNGWTDPRYAVIEAILAFFLAIALYPLFLLPPPSEVVVDPAGLILLYPRDKRVEIPWSAFQEPASGLATGTTPTTLSYHDARGRTRRVFLSEAAAAQVRDARASLGDAAHSHPPTDNRAASLAHPGDHVVVAFRFLTPAEEGRHKLTRRWLNRGPSFPLYAAHAAGAKDAVD